MLYRPDCASRSVLTALESAVSPAARFSAVAVCDEEDTAPEVGDTAGVTDGTAVTAVAAAGVTDVPGTVCRAVVSVGTAT